MQVIRFIVLVVAVLVCIIPTFTATADHGEFAHLFSDDEYNDIILKQRVRREIRNLTSDQWQNIVRAMHIMKTTDQETGEQVYGPKFENYDRMSCKHHRAVMDPEGDMGHVAPLFFTFHRIMMLEFEESLIAIDPTIETEVGGIPYWDSTLDLNTYGTSNLGNSIIFSDDYFGSITGNESERYGVTDGQFWNWTVHSNATEVGCPPPYQNPFGLLRSNFNPDNSHEHFTRRGPNVCNAPFDFWAITNAADYDRCVTNDSSVDYIEGFNDCITFSVHFGPHYAVGGTSERFDGQVVGAWPSCTSWHLGTTATIDGIAQWAS